MPKRKKLSTEVIIAVFVLANIVGLVIAVGIMQLWDKLSLLMGLMILPILGIAIAVNGLAWWFLERINRKASH